ncbi:signal transduction histidine kinase/ActR/RegA family two-component response regulator [Caulobacter ginsengisoli]|uniref:histidine kinase n=1 Tax=Caulobacter ginsengisoli TaxID=400775 RepID=A0ABU0IWS7_9CAUL|nr:response regulator [Caulobacter ginsengisoli]MDQ0466464.1 signal transduction histidine kinase/ActR/RegA family two-component response regulator [Caulobacter ginsengisoli]
MTQPAAPRTTREAMKLDGFIRHYRGMAIVRFGMVAGIVAILSRVASPAYVAWFGVLHASLYGVLMWAVAVAARDPDAARALKTLTVRTGLIVALISIHACWMALDVRIHTTSGAVRMEAGLLLIGVLMFTALQVHMSRLNYLAAIAPSIVSMLWIGIDSRFQGPGHGLVGALLIFVIAVVAATLRQQSTDRTLSDVRMALEEKNQELTEMVAEAQAARAAAEAANRAKSDFLAVTSHEIRTPLNAVLGLAEALRRETLSGRQRDLTEGIHEAGALLTRLLNAVLDISRIEAGKMTLAAAPFDVRRMAETLVKVWTPRASERGILLVLDLSDLPEPCVVRADGGKIEQALVNLVSNAVKFSPADSEIAITLAGRETEAGLALDISVADQGPGVSAEDRERIFEAYEQTDLGRGSGGAGLGLAICAGNLSLMGGAISVGEAPGGGALFGFSFEAPIAQAETTADAADSELDLQEGRPLRVLAAEDNAANRHVLRALLEPLPIELVLTEDGAQALEAMAAGVFDLVLMDANMPVMDGLTALKAIRARGGLTAATPVWMLTANVFEEDVARYRAAGADGVLRKPIDLDELFGAIRAAANRAETREVEAA